MAVADLSAFLDLLAESRLLSEASLRRVQAAVARASRPVSPREIADQLVKRGEITNWQAQRLLSGASSFRLGNYKLLEPIGQGGMGSVFKAEHAVMGRVVAVKILHKARLDNPHSLARFKREVKAAAALDHPNVVTAHDAGQQENAHFLVMEYVDGLDLNSWCKRYGRPSIPWCCEIIRQAALGLEHAHKMGLIHRDLKPANLLIAWPDPAGRPVVKISDLGLARFARAKPAAAASRGRDADDGDSGVFAPPNLLLDSPSTASLRRLAEYDDGVTEAGSIVGTPNFLSPEQIRGEDVDIRSDVFALGCTLFKLLTGQFPFGGQTIMDKLQSVANPSAPPALPLRRLVPHAPAALEAVVARMLAHDREDRHQTPADVAAALAPFTPASDAPSRPEDLVARGDETSFDLQEEEDEPPTQGTYDTGLMRFLEHLPAREESHSTTPSSGPILGRASAVARPSSLSSKRDPRDAAIPAGYWAAAGVCVFLASLLAGAWFFGAAEADSPDKSPPHRPRVAAPAWPTTTQGLVFAWRDQHTPVATADPRTKRMRECRVTPHGGAGYSPDGQMELNGGEQAMFTADEFASALQDACVSTSELTVEAVLTPNDLARGGPARIVSFSSGRQSCNFTLGQEQDKLVFRLRTTENDEEARKPTLEWHTLAPAVPVHVAITYRGGVIEGYVNGRRVFHTEELTGDFSKWGHQHLVFGNEWRGERPWKGRIKYVALFARRLDAAEIAHEARVALGG